MIRGSIFNKNKMALTFIKKVKHHHVWRIVVAQEVCNYFIEITG